MINVNLQIPNKITDLYRASNLRMPDVDEPVVIFYNSTKFGKGKIITSDSKTRKYSVELTNHEHGNPNKT